MLVMDSAQLVLHTYRQMLTALSEWLRNSHSIGVTETDVLLGRLADDMFPLGTQIRFACMQVYEGSTLLCGYELPAVWMEVLEEGRNGVEHPGTIEQAQKRIEAAVRFADKVDPALINSRAKEAVELKLPDGRMFDMSHSQYIRDWAMPQFYFHVTTAYAILRSLGASVGKADYLSHAFVYMRRG